MTTHPAAGTLAACRRGYRLTEEDTPEGVCFTLSGPNDARVYKFPPAHFPTAQEVMRKVYLWSAAYADAPPPKPRALTTTERLRNRVAQALWVR